MAMGCCISTTEVRKEVTIICIDHTSLLPDDFVITSLQSLLQLHLPGRCAAISRHPQLRPLLTCLSCSCLSLLARAPGWRTYLCWSPSWCHVVLGAGCKCSKTVLICCPGYWEPKADVPSKTFAGLLPLAILTEALPLTGDTAENDHARG